MSSPASPREVTRTVVLAAANRRIPPVTAPATSPRLTTAYEFEDFDKNHSLRKEFRRMINPGIVRNNAQPIALKALELLTRIADNILKNPGDRKYLRVNQTEKTMQKYVLEPKGTAEYLVKLGFRTKVVDFVPYYFFDMEKHKDDLRVGTHCLKEALYTETNKKEAAEMTKRQQKANEQAALTKVNNAFYDDRRRKKEQDERERAAREARAAAALQRQNTEQLEKGAGPVVRKISTSG